MLFPIIHHFSHHHLASKSISCVGLHSVTRHRFPWLSIADHVAFAAAFPLHSDNSFDKDDAISLSLVCHALGLAGWLLRCRSMRSEALWFSERAINYWASPGCPSYLFHLSWRSMIVDAASVWFDLWTTLYRFVVKRSWKLLIVRTFLFNVAGKWRNENAEVFTINAEMVKYLVSRGNCPWRR
jgi:hypothetical protein